MNRRRIVAIPLVGLALALAGCSEYETSSQNLTKAADNYEIDRRITVINGITDEVLFLVTGRCALSVDEMAAQPQLEVTCKVDAGDGDNSYKRHIFGLSDNVSYVAEQVEPVEADPFRYRFFIRPESAIPDLEVQTS